MENNVKPISTALNHWGTHRPGGNSKWIALLLGLTHDLGAINISSASPSTWMKGPETATRIPTSKAEELQPSDIAIYSHKGALSVGLFTGMKAANTCTFLCLDGNNYPTVRHVNLSHVSHFWRLKPKE